MKLTKEAIEYLKEEFATRWPDAARAINMPTTLPHERATKINAACMWLGFKEGYELAAPEAFKE